MLKLEMYTRKTCQLCQRKSVAKRLFDSVLAKLILIWTAQSLCPGQIETSTSPRAYPKHLTPLPSRGEGNLMIIVFRGWGI